MYSLTSYCPNAISSNIYLLEKEGKFLLIDVGYAKGNCLTLFLHKHHASSLEGILLTHGHFDHISGLKELLPLSCPLYFGEEDASFFENSKHNGSYFFLNEDIVLPTCSFLSPMDKEEFYLPPFRFLTLKTPYHTKGGISYYFPDEKICFSGDSLFYHGMGRVDLYGGEARKMQNSINKILSLPKEVIVYPGHGKKTTIAEEILFHAHRL